MELRSKIRELGGRVSVVLPPRVLIARLESDLARALPDLLGVEAVGTAALDLARPPYSAPDVQRAARLFRRRADPAYMEALARRLRDRDAAAPGPCGFAGKETARRKSKPPGATGLETSSWFYGTVAVGVVLPEGRQDETTDIEVWTEEEVDAVQTMIVDGYASFSELYPEADLTFVIRFESAPPPWNPIEGIVECDRDPIVDIQPRGSVNRAKIEQCAFASLGYGFTSGRAYVDYLREELGTSWGIALYVVDRSCTCGGQCPDPPAIPNCPRENAYFGGPSAVIWHDTNQRTLLHETGHLFDNRDEYPGANSSPTTMMGYLQAPNANSSTGSTGYFDGHGEGGPCLMSSSAPEALCPYTRHCFGWRDRDGDGLFDIVDTHPTTVLNPPQGGAVSGQADVTPVPRYSSPQGISLDTIASVECRIASGTKALTWLPATASDGTFDGASEPFSWLLPSLPDGVYQVEARAVNDFGNFEEQPSKRDLVVSGSGVSNAPPVASFVSSAAFGLIAVGRPVRFDARFDADHPYGVSDLEDLEGDLMVRWDFEGDGVWDTAYSSTKSIEYTYPGSGVVTPRLEVVDTGGATATASEELWVFPYPTLNFPPSATFTASPWTRQLGEAGDYFPVFDLDASGVRDVETPSSDLAVRWDFDGDGEWDTPFAPEKTASVQLSLPHARLDETLSQLFSQPPNDLEVPSRALYVSGDHVFIGCQSPPSLAVVELSTLNVVDVVSTAGIPYDMVAHPGGNRAVVSEGTAGVEWLTISDPPNSVNHGSVGHPFTDARGLSIESTAGGPLLYVASHDRVKIFNWIFDFYPPVFVSEAVTPSSADVVGRRGANRLYVANMECGGLQVFDTTDLGSPSLSGTLPGTGDARSLYEHGGRLLVCDRDGRILLVDATDASNPLLVKEFTGLSAPSNCDGLGAFGFAIEEGGGSLYTVDLATPDLRFALLEKTGIGGGFRSGLAVTIDGVFSTREVAWTVLDRYTFQSVPRHSLSWDIELEVMDADGGTARNVVTVWANAYNHPPEALLSISAIDGLTVSFSAEGSTDPDEGTSWDGYLMARWDFDGDGIWDTGYGSSLTAQHTYPAAGSYSATFEVRDRFGVFDEAEVQVEVE